MFILGMLVGIILVFIIAFIVVRKKFGIDRKVITVFADARRDKSLDLEDLFSEEEFDFRQSDFED